MTLSPTDHLSTAPGPASTSRRVLAQASFETRILLRNGEQLLVALILPALALIGLCSTGSPDLGAGPRVDVVAPGILALAVMSTAFTGQAIQTGFDRRYGVLRLLGTTPLGRAGLLAGKVVAVLAVELLQIVLLGAVALVLGWSPHLAGVAPALLACLVGTAAFVGLALLLAGTLRAEAVLAVANLVWVLLLAGGAVVVPADRMPSGVSHVASALPSGALGEALRAALGEGRLAIAPLLVLLGWAVLAGAVAARWFRWD